MIDPFQLDDPRGAGEFLMRLLKGERLKGELLFLKGQTHQLAPEKPGKASSVT
jgi:hypothetical protein